MGKKLFAENVNRLMKQHDISQSDLSRRTGISRSTLTKINKWMNESESITSTMVKDDKQLNSSSVEFSTIVKIANLFSVSIPMLFSRSDNLIQIEASQKLSQAEYMTLFIVNVNSHLKEKTQNALSYFNGVSQSTISEILSGKNKNPLLSTLEHISSALQTDLGDLFKNEEEKT